MSFSLDLEESIEELEERSADFVTLLSSVKEDAIQIAGYYDDLLKMLGVDSFYDAISAIEQLKENSVKGVNLDIGPIIIEEINRSEESAYEFTKAIVNEINKTLAARIKDNKDLSAYSKVSASYTVTETKPTEPKTYADLI